jgi:hypothetical protein
MNNPNINNNNNNNTAEDDRLNSIPFDLGSESIKENVIQRPLKSILKPNPNSNDDIEMGLTIIKACLIIVILLSLLPIVVCDLYFGYTDTTCINTKPSSLNMSMKLYLLISGFIGIGIILISIGGVCLISFEDNNNYIVCCISFIGIFTGLFQFIWNILGGIVFLGTVYKDGTCSESTSNYIVVSLTIKFIGNFISIMYNTFNKKN